MAKQGRTMPGEGGCYCSPDKRQKGLKPKTSPFLCECGFKVRGKNHAEGDHHNGTVKKYRRGSW